MGVAIDTKATFFFPPKQNLINTFLGDGVETWEAKEAGTAGQRAGEEELQQGSGLLGERALWSCRGSPWRPQLSTPQHLQRRPGETHQEGTQRTILKFTEGYK